MKIFLWRILSVTVMCVIFFETGYNQVQHASSKTKTEQSLSKKDLFGSDDTLKITLTGNIRELMSDKGNDSKSHPLILSCKTEKGGEDSLNIQAKTRGHFRKSMGHCTYPPLLLQFTKSDSLSSSIFREQKKLKLVMPCQGDDYVIREWLVYKIYNLVTPKSFKARLVSVELNDTKKKKTTPPFYGILLEEDQQMAKRNHNILIKKQLRPEQTDPIAFLKMAVFEYLIGNTDWSVQYQNIKLIAADSLATPIPVPYDFDHAGVVEAPYAKPAEELEMTSVSERRYRGYCVANLNKFDEVIAFYNHLQADIYKLYTGCPLLDTKYVKETIQYLDEFYKTINNPSTSKKAFSYPCDKNGTGNVIIKGLKDGHPPEQ